MHCFKATSTSAVFVTAALLLTVMPTAVQSQSTYQSFCEGYSDWYHFDQECCGGGTVGLEGQCERCERQLHAHHLCAKGAVAQCADTNAEDDPNAVHYQLTIDYSVECDGVMASAPIGPGSPNENMVLAVRASPCSTNGVGTNRTSTGGNRTTTTTTTTNNNNGGGGGGGTTSTSNRPTTGTTTGTTTKPPAAQYRNGNAFTSGGSEYRLCPCNGNPCKEGTGQTQTGLGVLLVGTSEACNNCGGFPCPPGFECYALINPAPAHLPHALRFLLGLRRKFVQPRQLSKHHLLMSNQILLPLRVGDVFGF